MFFRQVKQLPKKQCCRWARLSGFLEYGADTLRGRKSRPWSGVVSVQPADPRLLGRQLKRVAFDAETIATRVAELGRAITAAYPEGDLLVLGLLKGSFIFLSDLVRQIERPIQVDFLVASSYGDATESSGDVQLIYDPETRLEGRHILLVEDIVDSGQIGRAHV